MLDMGAMAVVFLFESPKLGFEFGAQPAQTASPTPAATNDGGVDQQFFPSDGNIERRIVREGRLWRLFE